MILNDLATLGATAVGVGDEYLEGVLADRFRDELSCGQIAPSVLVSSIDVFISKGMLDFAASTAIFCLENAVLLPDDRVNELLKKLATEGRWRRHNDLLVEQVLVTQSEGFLPALFHLLDQLDLVNAQRLLQLTECSPICARHVANAAKFACAVAEANYRDAHFWLDSAEPNLQYILENSRLRRWLLVLVSNSDVQFAERVFSTTVRKLVTPESKVEIATSLLQICWAKSWDSLAASLTRFVDALPESSLLRAGPIFFRTYLYSCQRLGLKSELLATLTDPARHIVDGAEITAFNLKNEILTEGMQALTARFGAIDCVDGRYLEIPLIVYGARYVSALQDYFVASALTSKDFMSLASNYEATISIMTTPDSVEPVRQALQPLLNAGFRLRIDPSFVVSSDATEHVRMWFVIYSMYRVEKNNGVYLMLCPDSIFGEGVSELIDKCPDGGGAGGNFIRCSWRRLSKSMVSGELNRVLKSRHRNKLLATLAVRKWSHYVQRLHFDNVCENFQSKMVGGRLLSSWFGIPNIVKPRQDFTENLIRRSVYRYSNVFSDHVGQVIDHELIGDLIAQNKLYMCQSFEEFIFIELANDRGYSQLWKTRFPIGISPGRLFGEVFATRV